MEAKHDTSLIKRVIEAQIENMRQPAGQLAAAGERLNAKATADNEVTLASTRRASMLTQGRRAMWFAGATSLVLISAAVAWWIAQPLRTDQITVQATPAVAPGPAPLPAPVFPEPRAGADGKVVPEVTNYVLFTAGEVKLGADGTRVVEAGHQYAKSGDRNYVRAWCYTSGMTADAVQARLHLGTLEPGGEPQPTPDPATAAAIGLTDEQVRTLFEACPWLPAEAPSAAIYRFTGEVTEQSVAALKRAVADGATTIELDSPGGDLGAAMQAFEDLHGAGLTMKVTGDCYSACTSLLAAGETRLVAAGGHVGVHQWKTVDAGDRPTDVVVSGAQLTSATLIDQFTRAGIEPQFFVAGATVPPNGMHELTDAELRDWNVVTAGVSS